MASILRPTPQILPYPKYEPTKKSQTIKNSEGQHLPWSASLRGANRRRRTRWRRHTPVGGQAWLRSALTNHNRTNRTPDSLSGITSRWRAWHTRRQRRRSSASWRRRRTVCHGHKLAGVRRRHITADQHRKNHQPCHNNHDKLIVLERQT